MKLKQHGIDLLPFKKDLITGMKHAEKRSTAIRKARKEVSELLERYFEFVSRFETCLGCFVGWMGHKWSGGQGGKGGGSGRKWVVGKGRCSALGICRVQEKGCGRWFGVEATACELEGVSEMVRGGRGGMAVEYSTMANGCVQTSTVSELFLELNRRMEVLEEGVGKIERGRRKELRERF